jgi:hypothetical protein
MFGKEFNKITYKDLNEFLYVIGLEENQNIELKREIATDKNGKPESKEFAKDVTALANTKGGYLFLGIDEEKKEICGINTRFGNQKIEDWISNVLNSLVDKTLNYEIVQIPISEVEDKRVVILNIPEGTSKPYYVISDNKYIPYIRKNTSVFPAKSVDIAAMYASVKYDSPASKMHIAQNAKGSHIQQIGQNFGKIIHTERIQNVTEVSYDSNLHISDSQAKIIKDKIDEIVDIHEQAGKFRSRTSKSKFYAETWQNLKNRFGITKYTLLPVEKYNECLEWLQSQIAYKHRPLLRKGNNSQWKNKMYGNIYARARSHWNLDKEHLYKFSEEKLCLKKPITSLKDLSDVNLNKLYKILFTLKEF